jgi:Beta-lactamase enzyme family
MTVTPTKVKIFEHPARAAYASHVGSPTKAVRVALIVILGVALIIPAARSIAARGASGGERSPRKVWPRSVYPSPGAIRRARRFAAARGDVSFAVIDRSLGLRGYDYGRQFSSASVSKALLLAAELRRLDREGLSLDSETKALLEPMITYSDNRAANAVYAQVGDEGLEEVARRAGMRHFEPTPGFWGGDRITAADTARFFYRLEANLPGPHGAYAKRLLSRITPVERWGIPQVVGRGWSVWFKGGWRPPGQRHNTGTVTHQAALLEHRRGERLALAVLTEEPPGEESGFAAIEGVAERLLASPPPYRGGWVAP